MTPAFVRGRDRRFGVRLRQRERLLAEDVLARLRRGDHLRRVQRVRRRQHDRVDARVGEQRLVSCRRASSFCASANAVHFGRHRARRARDEADHVAVALHRFDERPPPPPHADNRGSDQCPRYSRQVCRTRPALRLSRPASLYAFVSESARTSDPPPSALGHRQAQLLLHDVRALHQRHHLVERVPPAHALAPHAAVRRQHQPLGRDHLQRLRESDPPLPSAIPPAACDGRSRRRTPSSA